MTKGRGVSVHRVNCPNLKAIVREGQPLIDVNWGQAAELKQAEYEADLLVLANNRGKLLNDVIRTVNNTTKSLNSVNGRLDHGNSVKITLTVGVHNLEQLQHIIDSIRNIQDVYEVKRAFK